MTFLDVSSLKRISKTRKIIKMMTRAEQKWTPPNNHHTIKAYVEAVKKDIERSKTVTPRKIRHS